MELVVSFCSCENAVTGAVAVDEPGLRSLAGVMQHYERYEHYDNPYS